jgi:ParB family chromosome partitioning protein
MMEEKDLDQLIDALAKDSEKHNQKNHFLPLDQLRPFPQNPYRVEDNEEMEALTESIREQGILTPILVRRISDTDDGYEVISGHRRLYAAGKAGLKEVPVQITDMDRNAAAIALVDSNLHREHILPSEKAFAYKMKFEAISHQGRTSGQVGPKLSVDTISENDSGRQVKRYIRLTNLIPEILQLVDDGKIALTPAVELSYLQPSEQETLFSMMELHLVTPSLSQAQRLRRMSEEQRFTDRAAMQIMSEVKGNQMEYVKVPLDSLRSFFRPDTSMKQMTETLVKALEFYNRHLERQRQRTRDRDAR